MKRLVLIDGNAILHRAYHALPELTNKQGELINAVYGFSSMLLKVISELKPSYLIVTFDRKAPTFRKKIYENYQAKRPVMDEKLVSQVEKVHSLVKKLNIPIYELDGYEADDIIGTIAKQAKKQDNEEIVIVTGDKDILQLVDEKTKVFMLVKGLSQAKLYGIKQVKDQFGLLPEQIIDLKALSGDPSDNYPGIAGIGPKTALFLLQKYQSLDQLYQAIKKPPFPVKISDKVFNTLVEGYDNAYLCQKLATIVKNVPIRFEQDKAKWDNNQEKLEKVLLEFGFKSLAKRVNPPLVNLPFKKKESGQTSKNNNQLGLF